MRPRPGFKVAGIIVVLLFFAVFIWKLCRPSEWDDGTAIMAIALVYLLAYFFVLLPWRAKRSFKQNKFLEHKTTFRIDGSGLHTSSELGSVSIPWDHLRKWKENDGLVLLYLTDRMYYVFPKRLFESDSWQEFRDLAGENVKKMA